ncbi:MAG TPA: VOC family protein [Ignavibacteria bacterium]|nr:VOC family protein [Ignavibacteria bacterium]
MLPNNTHIQSVDLRVKDLEKSIHFYSYLLGLIDRKVSDNEIEFYSDTGKPYLIKVSEQKDAKYPARNNTGLFHTAIRLPNRKELARVFLRLFEHKYKFHGFSDHLVSESIYLADPDENGVELYADKSKTKWEWLSGQIIMDTLPLDLSVITKEIDDKDEWHGIHKDTDIGHIHLKVSNLAFAEMFYGRLLGFNVTNSTYNGALFLAAGTYHHHIGANVWQSHNGTSPDENTMGLISFSISIPHKNYLENIEKSLFNEGLLIEKSSSGSLFVKDFDNLKIHLTL